MASPRFDTIGLPVPRWEFAATCAMMLALTACGGGGSTSVGSATTTGTTTTSTTTTTTTTTASTVDPMDAARLLEQATFGVTASDVAHVQSIGIDAYISEQIAYPPTQYTGYSYTPHTAPTSCSGDGSNPPDAASLCAREQYTPFQVQLDFFTHALNNPDQLRQRVAFALSQIMVVSSVQIYEAYGLANFENILLNDAFGNYRTLLQDVTLSPTMGAYLDMADSDQTNPQNGTVPNQNYARELMQLFSIGLVELNPDGTQQLDATGAPIPTFDGTTIDGLAAVFTGWTYPPVSGASSQWTNPINYSGTMVSFPDHHQSGTKTLLNGYTVPAGQTPEQDLGNALDDIFNHPNVGPFISQQLIQHLVTSNPSTAYVSRMAAVFANNGVGVRGDLSAVVRAILEDPEARGPTPATNEFGHLREPALFITSTLRSLGGQSDGVLLRNASSAMGQPIYSPETVFSFYPPSYQIPGTQTLGPEFGIQNSATALARSNFINTVIMQGGAAADPTVTGSTGTSINLTALSSAPNNGVLIGQLNQTLMHGSLPSDASNIILIAADTAAGTSSNPLAAARTACYLILTSAQYQVER
ncbi:MAG: DUF1800 domain-containing protein [Steroidobacteraceae bacterium]